MAPDEAPLNLRTKQMAEQDQELWTPRPSSTIWWGPDHSLWSHFSQDFIKKQQTNTQTNKQKTNKKTTKKQKAHKKTKPLNH